MRPQPGFAVFQGTGGTVTVDNGGGAASVTGMQFAVNGYTVAGDALALSGTETTIRVGDGTAAGAGYTATVSATLTGNTTLVKTDLGTLVLSGANTRTGDTVVQAGALVLGGGNALADAGAVTVNADAALILAASETIGALNASGNLGLGANTLTVAGATVNGSVTGTGTLAVASGTLSGTGTIAGNVTIADGATLSGTQGEVLTMGSLVLNAGSQVNVSPAQTSSDALFDVAGNLTLDGTLNVASAPNFGAGVYRLFDYGGTLTDNGLALAPNSAAGLSIQTGTGVVSLVNSAGVNLAFWDGGNAALHFNGAVDGGTGTWAAGGTNWTDADGAINGPLQPVPSFAVFQGSGGTVTVDNGGGAASVTGMQFAVNGYTVASDALALSGDRATVRVGDGTSAGAGYTATVSAALTGASALVKTDLGTLVLTGANSYTGGTIVEAGTLVGDAASIRGDISNAGTVRFNQVSDASFGDNITGDGTYVKAGIGALTLTGTSSSDWTIEDGKLISTTTLFTGDVALGANGALVFDQAADGTYSGRITGTGDVQFSGEGRVRLTGDSSGFQGVTTVGAGDGVFTVNGVLGGTIEVQAGGRLQGNGTLGSGRIAGTIAPGNSIGTLTFNGPLTFVTGSDYEVEVNAAGQSDRIIVNGTATIQPGVAVNVVAEDGNYGLSTNYEILTASGGITGTFAPTVTSNLAFLTPSLSYTANAVTLRMARNTVDFVAVAQTSNQRAIAPVVEGLGLGNSVFDAVAGLSAAGARSAFDQLSGSDYASMRGQLIEDTRFVRKAMLSRGALAGETGVSLWGQLLGSWGDREGSANALRYRRDTQGLLTGFDGSFGENLRMGVAIGYSSAELRTANAEHKADGYHAGGYLNGGFGAFSVQVGAAYAWNEIDVRRTVAFGPLSQTLRDEYDARSLQLFGEVAAKASLGGIELQPFAGLAHVTLFDAKVAEFGGSAALRGGNSNERMTYGTLGLRTKLGLTSSEMGVRFTGSAAVRHAFGDRVPTIDLGFATGPAFTIVGAPIERNTAAVDAGLEVDLSQSIALGVSYAGNYGGRSTDHGARASLSWRF